MNMFEFAIARRYAQLRAQDAARFLTDAERAELAELRKHVDAYEARELPLQAKARTA